MNDIDLKYLPYGSIVKLKNDDRLYMIISLQAKIENNDDKKKYYADYISVTLPRGYTNTDDLVLFNATDIDKVMYVGYMNKKIESYYDDIKWEVDRRDKNGE